MGIHLIFDGTTGNNEFEVCITGFFDVDNAYLPNGRIIIRGITSEYVSYQLINFCGIKFTAHTIIFRKNTSYFDPSFCNLQIK